MKKGWLLIIWIVCLVMPQGNIYAAEISQEVPTQEAQQPLEEQQPNDEILPQIPNETEIGPQNQQEPIRTDVPAIPPTNESDSPKEGEIQQEFIVIEREMTANSEVNVRLGPDTAYKSIGRLEEGDLIYVLGKLSSNWYQIQYEEQAAYVSCDYLTDINIETENKTEEIQSENNIEQFQNLYNEIEILKREKDVAEKAAEVAKETAEKTSIKLEEILKSQEEEPANIFSLIIAGIYIVIFGIGISIMLIASYKPSRKKDDALHNIQEDGLEVICLSDSDNEFSDLNEMTAEEIKENEKENILLNTDINYTADKRKYSTSKWYGTSIR